MEHARALLARSVALPVVVAALAYLVIGWSASAPTGDPGDPSFLIQAGRTFVASDLLPSGSFIDAQTGYDGQFFFYLAQDPLLRGKAARRRTGPRPTSTTSPTATSASSCRSSAG